MGGAERASGRRRAAPPDPLLPSRASEWAKARSVPLRRAPARRRRVLRYPLRVGGQVCASWPTPRSRFAQHGWQCNWRRRPRLDPAPATPSSSQRRPTFAACSNLDDCRRARRWICIGYLQDGPTGIERPSFHPEQPALYSATAPVGARGDLRPPLPERGE